MQARSLHQTAESSINTIYSELAVAFLQSTASLQYRQALLATQEVLSFQGIL